MFNKGWQRSKNYVALVSIGVDDKLLSNKVSVSFPSLDIKRTISGNPVITKSSVIYTINFNSGKVTDSITSKPNDHWNSNALYYSIDCNLF